MTFTTKSGEKFEVGEFTTRTAPNGNQVITARVNTFQPKSGHGWSGIMTKAEVEGWVGR